MSGICYCLGGILMGGSGLVYASAYHVKKSIDGPNSASYQEIIATCSQLQRASAAIGVAGVTLVVAPILWKARQRQTALERKIHQAAERRIKNYHRGED